MATTLVIKSGDFSTNALDTVTFGDDKPCTGISLNESTLSINYGSTGSLTATATPSDTTDIITWTSSDNTVATVSNGTVTPTGVGSATITATCGEYSATCAVTVKAYMTENLAKRVGYYLSGNSTAGGGNGLPTWNSSNSERGGFACSAGTLSFYNPSSIYPYPMPANTASVCITVASGSKLNLSTIEWFNSETAASSSSTVAQLIIKNTSFSSTTDAQNNKVYNVDVPSNTPAINMIAIEFKTNDYSELTEAMLADVTVEFLPAAS